MSADIVQAAGEWTAARRALIDYTNAEGEWDPEIAQRLARAEGNLMRLVETTKKDEPA